MDSKGEKHIVTMKEERDTMQIAKIQSTEEENPLPHPLSEAQLLQPAIDDLISNRIVDGIAALEAVRVKYGLKSSTQSR